VKVKTIHLSYTSLIFILIAGNTLLLPGSGIAGKLLAKITLHSEQNMVANTPVSIQIDTLSKKVLKASLQLEMITGSQRIPVSSQIESGNSTLLWWILPADLKAGETQHYELVIDKSIAAPLVQIQLNDHALELGHLRHSALSYHYAPMPAPNQNSLYMRSAFIHPIWTPDGKVLTRIHPADHIHHMGFWNPWTKTEFEGRPVDFWNLGEGQGIVRFAKFLSITTGPVFGGFEALQEYVHLTAENGEKVALYEICSIRLWARGHPEQSYWIWDFTTSQTCANQSPFNILQYHYGGFGFRATSEWSEGNSDCLTSEGKTRKDGNGTRARWCNVFDTTDKGPAGILFLSHRNNHEHPEPMRIWPQGDIFFGFCPVVNNPWKMKPGNIYVRKYRIIGYDGSITFDQAEDFWQNFVTPANAKIEWYLDKENTDHE